MRKQYPQVARKFDRKHLKHASGHAHTPPAHLRAMMAALIKKHLLKKMKQESNIKEKNENSAGKQNIAVVEQLSVTLSGLMKKWTEVREHREERRSHFCFRRTARKFI